MFPLLKISSTIQVLDVLENPDDLAVNTSDRNISCSDLSIMNYVQAFLEGKEELVEMDEVKRQFMNGLFKTDEEICKIELCTSGQNSNPDWHEIRKGMLTASKFKIICRSVDNNKAPPSLIKSIFGEYKDADVPALNWGRKKEKHAIDLYMGVSRKQHRNPKLKQPGFLVDKKFPFIGCSADGIFSCKCHLTKLVEVKCPYTGRDLHPKEVALTKGCEMVDDKLVLQHDSDYFHQVQGQMGIYGYSKCDLVIYTKNGICVVNVEFDKLFFDSMLKKLTYFFKEHLLMKMFEKFLCDGEDVSDFQT